MARNKTEKIKKSKEVKKKRERKKIPFKVIFVDLLFMTVGAALYAVSVNMFTSPNQIAPGGVTGLAIIIEHLTAAPIGVMMFLLNVPLLIIGFIKLGKQMVLRTLAATVLVSAFVDGLAPFLPAYTEDKLLASIFGGLLAGGGLVLVFLRGATTGGTDILARLLQLKWPYLSFGRMILGVDMLVVLLSGLVFRSLDSVLYAAILIFISSKVIDTVLYGTGNGKLMMVITNKGDEIAQVVTKSMQRGVTVLPGKGGYTGGEKAVLMCAVRRNELYRLRTLVRQYDPQAFMMITEVGEILGEGFQPPKT